MNRKHLLGLTLYFLDITQASAHETGSNHLETDTGTLILIFLGSLLSVIIPLLLGLFSFYLILKSKDLVENEFLIPSGISFGIIIFLLFDYISLASLFNFPISRIIFQTIKIFIVVLAIIGLSTYVSRENSDITSAYKYYQIWILGLFIHTIGEGIIMGHNFTLGLVTAFSPFSILSYGMHKFAEGFVGATLLTHLVDDDQVDIRNVLLKTSIFVTLSVIPGVILGYFSSELGITDIDSITNSIVFTLGFVFILFVLPFITPRREQINKENFGYAIVIGLLFMFFSVVLHEI